MSRFFRLCRGLKSLGRQIDPFGYDSLIILFLVQYSPSSYFLTRLRIETPIPSPGMSSNTWDSCLSRCLHLYPHVVQGPVPRYARSGSSLCRPYMTLSF